MKINRYISIEKLLKKGKALVIFGPRQSGKTYLVNEFLKTTKEKFIFETGTLKNVQEKFLNGPRQNVIDDYGLKYDIVIIDEAQMIPTIGESMKALIDLYPNIKVILTGSSSFELAGQIGEPLLGRQNIVHLYTVWEQELLNSSVNYTLEERLIYGSYPEILLQKSYADKINKLQDLANANLFKDVLAYDRLKKPFVIIELVKLLALQIGSEVSVLELARSLGVDQKTVEKYLDILEKAFIILTLNAYSKNERTEIKKKKKYYFCDLGIRNVMANNFNDLGYRTDIGHLFENFCILERLKRNSYTKNWVQNYFWRTTSGGEVDYIEIKNEKLEAFEFKWNENKFKQNKNFKKLYPKSKIGIVNRENYRDFIL